MSTTLSEEEKRNLNTVIATLRKAGLKNYPFHRAIVWIVANRPCTFMPQVPEPLRSEVTATITAKDFTVNDATTLLDKLRAAMMPESQLASVAAFSCPLVELAKPTCATNPDGTTVCTMPKLVSGAGCDDLAGRLYFAKTDGFSVWFAAMLFEERSRVPASQPESGIIIESITEMILYHEFAHIMHLDPTTTQLFDRVQTLYWEAAKQVPLELRRSQAIVLGHADMLEFVAYAFGVESARRDRARRTLCPAKAAAEFLPQ